MNRNQTLLELPAKDTLFNKGGPPPNGQILKVGGRPGTWAVGVSFTKYDLFMVNFAGLNFFDCDFRSCDLMMTEFSGCVLEQCKFDKDTELNATDFRGSVIKQCDLTGLDLSNIEVNEETQFESVEVSSLLAKTQGLKTTISRRQLDLLRNNGGLTIGQLRNMDIRDDINQLRSTFSGFWNTVHTFSIVVFLSPYILFVVEQWVRSRLARIEQEGAKLNPTSLSDENSSMIITNLARFIVSGGETSSQWSVSPLAIVLFLLALSVFALRTTLFIKTKLIEHYHQVHGFYPEFELKGKWKTMHEWFPKFAMLGISVVVVHTIMLLFHRVPHLHSWKSLIESQ